MVAREQCRLAPDGIDDDNESMAGDAGTDYTCQDAGPDTESRDNLLIARVDCAHPEPLRHHPPPPPPLPAGIKDLSAKIVVARLPRAFHKQKQDVCICITRHLVIYVHMLLVKFRVLDEGTLYAASTACKVV